ncbi:hypothetical protein N0V90_010646 [Kalmusia sp. IMI 367209]|nr:hypothetical protein N0V90_010646 [Kalmusia sp. IMI 367209]
MATSNAYHVIESVVQFSDERAKEKAFDHHWKRVEDSAANQLELETLGICVRLLPSIATTERAEKSYLDLRHFIFNCISAKSNDETYLFSLAEICLQNARLGYMVFDDVTNCISAATDSNIEDSPQETSYRGMTQTKEEHLQGLVVYYTFLKCSYWLPADQYHYITPTLLSLLVRSVGQDGLDEHAHDTLSALLSLLANPSVVVLEAEALPETWTHIPLRSNKRVLKNGVLQASIFDRLQDLPLDYFSTNASKAFRSWFQWISYIHNNAVQTEIIYSPKYWKSLRTGLMTGFADQRKYCLGIIRQSLALCQKSFETSEMELHIEAKGTTTRQYDRFCTLYETVVLDRYPNQVQACLPELTTLLGPDSLIFTTWTTALLSAALNSKIQDGIRKLVGNWYLGYAISQPESCITHASFLIDGFLPWATQGSLFTSSIVSTRASTTCSHGAALANAIAQLHMNPDSVIERYVLDTGGRIFSPSVLFLLDGLLQGVKRGGIILDSTEIGMKLCEYQKPQILNEEVLPAQAFPSTALENLPDKDSSRSTLMNNTHPTFESAIYNSRSLKEFLEELDRSQHKIIQKDAFEPACAHIATILDDDSAGSFLPNELVQVLDAFWEEADRQDYPRPVAIRLSPLFFHPTVIRICVQQNLREGEFLFEMVAAQKLAEHLPHSDYGKHAPSQKYTAYYGQREWVGYAAVIDLLNRFPKDQSDIAKRVMNRLLEPWRTQKVPVPIISKWKNVFQLQIMLLLTELCVNEVDADWYLDSFMHALVLEPWPRYRYLIEWIITRIYFRFPSKARRILDDLESLDENSPVHIASLMKLALLASPFLDSQEFTLKFMIQLIPFSASPKVQIRHEAHWCFPTLFDLAMKRHWDIITTNPAFMALDKHVRSLDKFSAPPSTIRTLKLDAVNDFNLTSIFQGQYLRIETPDIEFVAHEDFLHLRAFPLGHPFSDAELTVTVPEWKKQASATDQGIEANTTFFQTKSGFDVASLLPSACPPGGQQKRPASVILIASLIDNPTNLGGLSRISESFGLEALYIDDLKKTAHKDFKATSVTSEKHFPIRELKILAVPEYLISMKRQGYEIIGIEQTDKSGILGEQDGGQGLGTLPKKCVLVLGSERGGISSEVLAAVDRCVEIKTVGVTRSLNVQTAGGIAVYEWWREWGERL